MVDASDKFRIKEARSQLKEMSKMEVMKTCPIVVMANKVDRTLAMTEEEVSILLDLNLK